MLWEVRNPRQIKGEGPRRWFTDEYFDLIVWYEKDGAAVRGFQLCYDKGYNERALTWWRDGGFDHRRIDDGELPGRMKMTPVLVPDGAFDFTTIAERFQRNSEKIDPEIRSLVYDTVMRYPRGEYAQSGS
ncbi:MAG: hypothetical protein JSV89_04035 [Spirochaetaceae bacterium]|nr:MAG: hypothetical protein JSV89_04035 [Spirochaetaceae bacterium]